MNTANYSSLNNAGPCQNPELIESTLPYPRILTRLRLTLWCLRREGVLGTLRRVINALAPGIVKARSGDARITRIDAVPEHLSLQPGEWVQVRSKEEILLTLDRDGKHRGLRFVPEMFDFCGQRFRVFKRVEKICIDNMPGVRTIKSTVLLEGGICKGGGIGCDRACFHFWREGWLRRVEDEPTKP